ncbi:MAG: response regulator, partial [Rhodobacterales bacterium]|nr:response regulator [Rhodobacterales bacterium]
MLIDTAQYDERRVRRMSEYARMAAAATDVRLEKLLDLTRFCASSDELVARLDLEAVARNCGRYAALLGAWVVVVETGEIHRQILNTRPDAPEVLPALPRQEERPELLSLEARSRQTGAPGIANVFTGIIYPGGVLSTGQFLRLADGRPAMLYVSLSTDALSDHLTALAGDGTPVIGLVDPSGRIVARSVGIDHTFFAEIGPWLRQMLESGGAGASLDMPVPDAVGGLWDMGYHPLAMAPGWMATAAVPSRQGVQLWSLLSLPSGLSALGLLLSGLFLWVITARDVGTRRITLAEQARAAADRENQEKSRLLSSFAHDIRNPLISLIGSLELRSEAQATGSEQIGAARSSAESLLQMVDDILELAFLGSPGFTLHPSPVDLKVLAEDLFLQIRAAAHRKGLTLSLDLDKTLPGAVEVDRLRLQQVLSNLLTNAVKYTEQGTVTLRIGSQIRPDEAVELVFTVADTGVGFKPEEIPKILREFGRLDRDIEQREQGTGLGLAIVQRILRAMGASLKLESAPGEGSTFEFHLVVPIAVPGGGDIGAQPLEGLVIVYAEDEPVIRQVTTRRLVEAGAKVIEAVDGADALRHLATLTPDILLLDLQMPGLDGAAVIKHLRAADQPRLYPIFVLTSHISGPQTAQARASGADVVFTKPVQIHPLAAAFRARRGDGGRHTPTIGGQPSDDGLLLVDPENFMVITNAADRSYATEIIAKFETSMRADLDRMQSALAGADLAEVQRIAHRCIGLCQVMGA